MDEQEPEVTAAARRVLTPSDSDLGQVVEREALVQSLGLYILRYCPDYDFDNAHLRDATSDARQLVLGVEGGIYNPLLAPMMQEIAEMSSEALSLGTPSEAGRRLNRWVSRLRRCLRGEPDLPIGGTCPEEDDS